MHHETYPFHPQTFPIKNFYSQAFQQHSRGPCYSLVLQEPERETLKHISSLKDQNETCCNQKKNSIKIFPMLQLFPLSSSKVGILGRKVETRSKSKGQSVILVDHLQQQNLLKFSTLVFISSTIYMPISRLHFFKWTHNTVFRNYGLSIITSNDPTRAGS